MFFSFVKPPVFIQVHSSIIMNFLLLYFTSIQKFPSIDKTIVFFAFFDTISKFELKIIAYFDTILSVISNETF